MINLVSPQCVDFVKSFEGFSATPYYDIVGVKTIGYGMTGSEIAGLYSVTEKQASDMLKNLLNNNYALPLKNNLDSKKVNLNQNQFDALVSMAYNVGINGLLGSTLYRNVCAGVRDVNTITENFCAWSYAGGKVIAGLLRRRKDEANMFFGSGNENIINKGDDFQMDVCVVYYTPADFSSALILANLNGSCGMFCRNASANVNPIALKAKKIINVGGPKLGVPGEVYLSGNTAGDTLIIVSNYLKGN